MKYCIFCGAPKDDIHHLIYGDFGANRKLATEDGLLIPLCRGHHELIHKHYGIESKAYGQFIWELTNFTGDKDETRQKFRERYGKSWL